MKFCCPNPPEPPCGEDDGRRFFAQFAVQSSPPSGSELPILVYFQEGEQIRLEQDSQIILPPGYLYLINYLFLAIPEADGYMQIIPKINNSLRLLYASYAPAGSVGRNATASGSFTTNEALTQEAMLSFHLTYPPTVRNIDITGAISVTPVIKI